MRTVSKLGAYKATSSAFSMMVGDLGTTNVVGSWIWGLSTLGASATGSGAADLVASWVWGLSTLGASATGSG